MKNKIILLLLAIIFFIPTDKIYGDDDKLRNAIKNITSPENIAYVPKT